MSTAEVKPTTPKPHEQSAGLKFRQEPLLRLKEIPALVTLIVSILLALYVASNKDMQTEIGGLSGQLIEEINQAARDISCEMFPGVELCR